MSFLQRRNQTLLKIQVYRCINSLINKTDKLLLKKPQTRI